MIDGLIAYRHAAYDTPWWAFPSSRSGRFHRGTVDTTQYLCLHPLGPAAEMLRHHVGPSGDADDLLLNLWVMVVYDAGLVRITFDDCEEHGITPEELVGDDHGPTQALADRVRSDGNAGMIVPSAALPGTENVVLFGPRLLTPYLDAPISAVEIPTGHLTDGARPPAEARALVRWLGGPHASLEQWTATGAFEPLPDPLAFRW